MNEIEFAVTTPGHGTVENHRCGRTVQLTLPGEPAKCRSHEQFETHEGRDRITGEAKKWRARGRVDGEREGLPGSDRHLHRSSTVTDEVREHRLDEVGVADTHAPSGKDRVTRAQTALEGLGNVAGRVPGDAQVYGRESGPRERGEKGRAIGVANHPGSEVVIGIREFVAGGQDAHARSRVREDRRNALTGEHA